MPRRTFDAIVSSVGVLLTAVLVIAGGLLFWGYSFANGQVYENLKAQNIYFPEAGSETLASAEIGPYLNQYAGQQLLDGEQARAYANHYIWVHLQDVADGKTYSEVSSLARQNPDDPELAAQVESLFRGTTLRGMLLDAYAFWKFGQLAMIGSLTAFGLAAIMAVLTVLGFRHLRRVSPNAQIFRAAAGPLSIQDEKLVDTSA
ncbi:MAG TPA: hypothetical protein VF129_07715 [Actinomycetota bacterium]